LPRIRAAEEPVAAQKKRWEISGNFHSHLLQQAQLIGTVARKSIAQIGDAQFLWCTSEIKTNRV
jgi:hypothetical protein